MVLEPFDNVHYSAEDSAYWWFCTNEDCVESGDGGAIAAPEYDWIYWYAHIPESDLLEYPGLKSEWEQARTNYLNRKGANANATFTPKALT